MEPITLDLQGIHEYQQNRAPFLFVDRASEIIPGVSAKGYKNLTMNDWFFPVHFPGDPNMPGMLQVEAMVQLSALILFTLPGNKGKVAYMTTATNIKLFQKVLPGDRFDMEVQCLSFRRGIGSFSAKAFVAGKIVSQAEFSLVLPHVLNEFKVLTEIKEKA
jgi:3-hydroxyacyl-[acyl-carrier-protein] dehydratase